MFQEYPQLLSAGTCARASRQSTEWMASGASQLRGWVAGQPACHRWRAPARMAEHAQDAPANHPVTLRFKTGARRVNGRDRCTCITGPPQACDDAHPPSEERKGLYFATLNVALRWHACYQLESASPLSRVMVLGWVVDGTSCF